MIPLFDYMNIDSSIIIEKKLRKGQMVVDTINGQEYVGIITKGCIDVYSVALDGRELKLSTLHQDDMFGICNLYVKNDLETVLKASQPTIVRFIPKAYLKQALATNPKILESYLVLCNTKIQFLLRRIEELTMQSSSDRILMYLETHAGKDGKVEMSITREELATQLGISKATLYRQFARYKNENMIYTNHSDIYIRREIK